MERSRLMQPTDKKVSETTFRAAEPTVDEGRVYARYLDEVTEGFMRMRLGRGAPDVIAKVFTQPNHDLSYQNVSFVERQGRIVGMAAGFTAEQQRRFSEHVLRREVGGLALRVRTTAILFAPLLRILETIEDSDFYIVTMIIDGDLRGLGVGSEVLKHLEQRAHKANAARITLDVANNNEGARRLYERKGWVVESQWPSLPLIPPIFHRMAKPIG
jgi:ribosomal protein S18 acetylase RimI-like enzyme